MLCAILQTKANQRFFVFQVCVHNASWERLRRRRVRDTGSEYGSENRGGGRRGRTGRSPIGGGLARETDRAAVEVHDVEVWNESKMFWPWGPIEAAVLLVQWSSWELGRWCSASK